MASTSDTPMDGERWLPCEDAFLAERYAAGEQAAVIAQRLGRTEVALWCRRKKLRIRRARIKGATVWDGGNDDLAAACSTADDVARLAARLGRSHKNVIDRRAALKARGVRVKRISSAPWPPEVFAEALALKASGVKPQLIADRLGYSKSAVIGKLWRHANGL